MRKVAMILVIGFFVTFFLITGVYRSVNAAVTAIDWRTRGAVTGVKDEGQLDASWAFAAVGAIEGCHQIATGSLISLSEQQLLECSAGQGADCEGTVPIAFQSVIDAGGIESEAAYPYTAVCAANLLCSVLGDNKRRSPDEDTFTFFGGKGDNVTIRLVAEGGTGSEAQLILRSKRPKHPLKLKDRGPLPLEVSAVLPASGTYEVRVVESPPAKKALSYSGDYCLPVTGLTGELETTDNVEQFTYGACKFSPSKAVADIENYYAVTSTEAALQSAILVRPVATRLKIGDKGQILQAFALYISGIFNSTDCDDSVVQWVTIVGMNTDPFGNDYYIVKNSWGTGWGQQGYIWIKANSNTCGIADSAYYPTYCE